MRVEKICIGERVLTRLFLETFLFLTIISHLYIFQRELIPNENLPQHQSSTEICGVTGRYNEELASARNIIRENDRTIISSKEKKSTIGFDKKKSL